MKLALPNPGRERVMRGRRATPVELAGQLARRVAVVLRELVRLRGRSGPVGDPAGTTAGGRRSGRVAVSSPARGGTGNEGSGPVDAGWRLPDGPAQFVVPGEVADVTHETEDGELNAFVVRLPEGKPLWLHDTMALIWSLAADGAPDVVAAVAEAVGEESTTVRAATEAALAELVVSGLLVRGSDD